MENSTNPKLKKEFDRWKKNKEKKLSAKELKEIKKLANKALSLWRQCIKRQAMGICEAPNCKKTKKLNAHHIESYSTNKILRFDPHNGILFCSTHHKWGRISAHKSFCFMYKFMRKYRMNDLDYLLTHYENKTEITKDFLEKTIEELSQ
jgi:hypothetical protein